MALFEEKHYGKPISELLSKYLKDWTSRQDIQRVSIETGISTSTIRDVSYGYNSLTEGNSKGVIELMKIAVRNCSNKITYAKEVIKYAERNMDITCEELV